MKRLSMFLVMFLMTPILSNTVQAQATGTCTAGTEYCEASTATTTITSNSDSTTTATTTNTNTNNNTCLLYTSPSPRDLSTSRMPSSA